MLEVSCSNHVHFVKDSAIHWKLNCRFSESFAQNNPNNPPTDSIAWRFQWFPASSICHKYSERKSVEGHKTLPENWTGENTFDIDKFKFIISCSLFPLPWKFTIYFIYDLWWTQIRLVLWAVDSISPSTREHFSISNT